MSPEAAATTFLIFGIVIGFMLAASVAGLIQSMESGQRRGRRSSVRAELGKAHRQMDDLQFDVLSQMSNGRGAPQKPYIDVDEKKTW